MKSAELVSVEGLVKTYAGGVRALDGVDLSIGDGEVFGLLGPNGAGKTTTIKILVTLLRPDGGRAAVAGHDVVTAPEAVRPVIGYVSQEVAVDRLLSGRENLELLANLYHLPPATIRARVDELLALVELTARADDPVRSYSGGMRKRLDIVGALLHRPRLLVLDEPTLGLDIQTRHRIWETVRSLGASGTTVLLTTHYMEEADQLCDRVAIIDHGRIQVTGTPAQLKAAVGGDCVELLLGRGAPAGLTDEIARLPGVAAVQGPRAPVAAGPAGGAGEPAPGTALAVWVSGEAALPGLLGCLAARGVELERMTWTRPTLDEVFLRHTGHKLRD